MPIKYICKKCGSVIYVFSNVGQDFVGVRTPTMIASELRVCPRCGRNLRDFDEVVIKVRIK